MMATKTTTTLAATPISWTTEDWKASGHCDESQFCAVAFNVA